MHGVRRKYFGKTLRAPLGIGILVAGLAAWGVSPAGTTTIAHAAGICALNMTLPNNLGDGLIHGTWDYNTVISQFDSARASESCGVKLEDQFATMGITATVWGKTGPRKQMLWLFNAERTARGLGTLSFDPNLMSRVDYNHSLEMKTYGYFNHPSPINHPGWNGVFSRLTVNPAISGHWSNLGENIAAVFPDAAQATWGYMYHDQNLQVPADNWGHRKNILGGFNWVGIGVVKYSQPLWQGGPYGYYYSSDFMQSSNYQRPTAVDTQAPTMSPPTLTCNSNGTLTVQVTPSDTGAVVGEAGVSDVVVSVGQAQLNSDGTSTAKELKRVAQGSSTWSTTLPSSNINLGAIHVVATDGSGNFTDVQSTKSAC